MHMAWDGRKSCFPHATTMVSCRRDSCGRSGVSVEWMALMGTNEFEARFGLGREDGDYVEEKPVGLVEVAGTIKWFDVAKGYGFIVPDNGGQDILLHVSVLRRDGYQAAFEGARVVVEAIERPKGMQVFRLLSMDESTAIHPAQMPPARTHVQVVPTGGFERTTVKWFNRLRGFGFVS